MNILLRWSLTSLSLALGACAAPGAYPTAQVLPATAPIAWQAPLPHGGQTADLRQWWQQQGDALLAQLITQAQAASPDVANARTQIEQARSNLVNANAALLPSLDATTANTARSVARPGVAPTSSFQGGLLTVWELDLLGANAALKNASQDRLSGSQALWHDARVSVAAEVASQYIRLRGCEQQLVLAQKDAQSRNETARLTQIGANAGLQAPAAASLARASAAEGRNRAVQQQAECDLAVKALVVLTAQDEPALRAQLTPGRAQLPALQGLNLAALPADVIAQRPDVFNAAREVLATAREIDASEAQRYPKLTLNGSITRVRSESARVVTEGKIWSVGPIALTLPVFDGGRIAAATAVSRIRHEESVQIYTYRVRQAVREVEEALIQLASTGARHDDARTATEGYAAALGAAQTRWQHGLASLVELEDARRTALAAESAQVTLSQDRLIAWVTLYRAAGGGWTPTNTTP